jgi:hypothetical protein
MLLSTALAKGTPLGTKPPDTRLRTQPLMTSLGVRQPRAQMPSLLGLKAGGKRRFVDARELGRDRLEKRAGLPACTHFSVRWTA